MYRAADHEWTDLSRTLEDSLSLTTQTTPMERLAHSHAAIVSRRHA
jgi:hypothetical protein